jgi:A/G-specific adenine glycosylase
LLVAWLLAWYDAGHRALPWRGENGATVDPYCVWISEIMLQQTTVAAVIPYYHRFLARWPTVQALAAADLDAVLHAWQGLGYYGRARNLHACARVVVSAHAGAFPSSLAGLRALPGIGEYTAAAIAAIAFGVQVTPVDGNVTRVLARLAGVAEPLPRTRPVVAALATRIAPALRSGDFAQALMDLGATVCLPRAPLCLVCPWRAHCRARAEGDPERLPVRGAAMPRPQRYGVAFWIENARGAVLFRRRPTKGLLGGLMEVPSTPWRQTRWTAAEAIAEADGYLPSPAQPWQPLPGRVQHTFTHFHLELTMLGTRTHVDCADPGILWVAPANVDALALPTLMRKLVQLAAGTASTDRNAATTRRKRRAR